MQLKYYPSLTHLVNTYRKIGGNQSGIIPGTFISTPEFPGEPFIRTVTAQMPAYHKMFLNPLMDVQYHLAGYGLHPEEALIKLIGESIERYAALIAMRMLGDRIRYSTYSELSRSEVRCMPLEYLALFEAEQQRQLHEMMEDYSPELPTSDDIISWVRCPSLIYPGEEIWIPAQLFFLGFKTNPREADKLFVPAFSTGTAAHLSIDMAIKNALIESIQIDAVMLHWYTGAPTPRVIIDDEYLDSYFTRLGLGHDSPYEVWPIYVSRPELPLPNFVVYLIRKDERAPYISVGVQAEADPRYAIVRGTQESIGVLTMGVYGAIHASAEFFSVSETSPFVDLDTNVFFYANPAQAALKKGIIDSRIKGEIDLVDILPWADSDRSTVNALIAAISELSEWAVYLDITPVELYDSDWRVIRTFIPELCSLCLPGMPPRKHPRLQKYGGVVHDRPHPLP